MRVGWLVDWTENPGGAELTQAEFRAAAPAGVSLVECRSGEIDPDCDRSPAKATIIYGLVDPRTDRIRYIGKTTWSLSHRLRTHMAEATAKPHTHKARWLNSLRAKGSRPRIVALEVVAIDEWEAAERRWIARIDGLTNVTAGGEVGGWGWQGGEQCPHARLTEANVVDISARFASGGVTQQQLADEYGVSIKAISLIVRGINWPHVDRPLTFRGRGAKGVTRNQGNRHGAKDCQR